MYLKRVDLQGFKSFTNKTKVSFEPGISCIVGPNGSGKSNIADALRWVLGEQSARNIRGGKLEDVIFSGSKKRRALGLAEVTILLDNSDGYLPLPFTEISVSRRAVRNGPSEYFINGQPCRLKDIRDLFVDTGIGVDGLSLINQGRINELVTARPEERRALVEEAAGIIKYRDRKKEALRKLEETQRHLERIGDIIYELSGRIEPLRQQSEKARRYLALQGEADQLEIGISVKVLTEAEERIRGLDQEIGGREQDLLADESARLELSAGAEELRLQIAAIDEEAAAASRDYYELQNQREKAEGVRALAISQQQNADENALRLSKELEALLQNLAARQGEEAALAEHIRRTQEELADQERAVLSGEGGNEDLRMAAALAEERLHELQRQEVEAGTALAAAIHTVDLKQQLADKNRENAGRLSREAAAVGAELAAARDSIAQAEQLLAETRRESKEVSALLNDSGTRLKQLNQQTQELAAEEAESRYQVHSLQAKVAMLEEMSAGYEGFFPGVKGLMTACRKGQGPAGVVDVLSELMEVPDQYRVAVEAYLGANIQNVVVESGGAAKQAVAFLKQRQLGRATFLPLDILKVREPQDFSAAMGLPGVYGRASQLIGCDNKYRKAVDFLLNNVLLCDDLDTAMQAAGLLKYRASVVTLDGDMVNPGATVSGGSRQAKAGELLGKKSRLEEARRELEAAQEQLRGQEQALGSQREKARAEDAANEQLRERLRQLTLLLNSTAAEQEKQQALLKGYTQRASAISAQLRELDGEMAGLEEEVAEALTQQRELETAARERAAALTAAAENLAALQQQLDSYRDDITEQKMALATSRQKLHGQNISLNRLREDIENLGWEAESKAEDLEAAEHDSAARGAEIRAALDLLQELALKLHDAEERMNGVKHDLSAENARLAQLEAEEREHVRSQDKLKTELHQLQLRRERWQADFENEAAKLAEKFRLDLAGAQARVGETPARNAMNQRLTQLRREIAALGVVNVSAIDEYAEVSQRYEFMTGQREDMLTARERLDQVIGEMDQIMAGRFRDTFVRLSGAFNDSFQRLFGGGEASLYLSDPEQILETGVEIAVHPPGKKVSNYNLLSGGEKALIGIALMFAILAVRPTPFCVMDEVDAALDEANIDRFTAYLKDQAAASQFVMISHRQSTMEAASALWGVTMEEEGVSKVIGVKLGAVSESA